MKKLLVGLAAALVAAPPGAKADSEFSVVLLGGAAKYNQSLSGADVGAAYGARLGIMPTPIIGFELGYLGSQNNFKATLDTGTNQSTIRTNGGYADLRLNVLPGAVTPYAFGGYGRTWFRTDNADANGFHNTGVNTLPFGAGVEVNAGAFKIGGRFQYNYLFDKIYTGAPTATGAAVDKGGNADFYNVSVDLGASFR